MYLEGVVKCEGGGRRGRVSALFTCVYNQAPAVDLCLTLWGGEWGWEGADSVTYSHFVSFCTCFTRLVID